MAAFNGTWQLKSLENFEAYLDAIGIQGENREKALKFLSATDQIKQKISISGKGVSIESINPLRSTEVTGDFGQSVSKEVPEIGVLHTVFSLEGDQLVEQQSGVYTSRNVRRIEGNQMIMTFAAANGVTSTRRYEKLD